MPMFTVELEKMYANKEDGDDTITLQGTMQVEASSQEEADNKVREELEWKKDGPGIKTLQTIDPRITWEDDAPDPDVYEYVDFTFGLVSDS